MYSIELVEGKNQPHQSSQKNLRNKQEGTAGLLIRLCESIMHSGRVVTMDSGFCVLQALIEILHVGVYSSALIKKRRYWPKYIDSEGIDQHFQTRRLVNVTLFQELCLARPLVSSA
jgi:Transposase IS4